jgi:hypothetical protein
MGSGHDTAGRTWILVGLGKTQGWVERSNVACKF